MRPEWIVDSIAARRVLSHEGYVLRQLRGAPGQATLRAFQPVVAAPPGAAEQQLRSCGAAVAKQAAAGALPVPAVLPPQHQQQAKQAAASPGKRSLRQTTLGVASTPGVAAGRNGIPSRSRSSPVSSNAPLAAAAAAGMQTLPQRPGSPSAAATAVAPPTAAAPPAATSPGVGRPSVCAAPCTAAAHDSGAARAQAVAAQQRAACDVLRMRPRTTRDDARFMETYYKSSRLHFIGRWKARIEALALALQDKGPAPCARAPAAGATGGPCAERVILHVDMDCFFASVATLADPLALRGRPLAVSHSNSTQGSGEVRAHGAGWWWRLACGVRVRKRGMFCCGPAS